MVSDDGKVGDIRAWLLAVAGIVLLMWPALLNRQPFYFSDTTSYVRAGDLIAQIVAGPAATTVWTRADFTVAPNAPTPPVAAPAPHVAMHGNDLASGSIMAGRSPYFGAVLWLSWIASHFWLFVLAQAVIAWLLIGLALRCFGLDRPGTRLGVAAALALATPLALYNGLLLADALSGFGIAAFLILAAPQVRLARWERIFLIGLLLASAISHLTHIVMLLGMTTLLCLIALAGRLSWASIRSPMLIGAGCVLVGLLSVVVTSWAVEARFGKRPVLVPLMTARFIADGPGRTFIEGGCDRGRFAVCRLPYRGWTNSTDFLWSRDPARGAFLLADPATREAMSHEDKAFAAAVLLHYPVRTIGRAGWNTLLQISDLRVDVADERCFIDPHCIGDQFPPAIAHSIATSPGGRGGWPVPLMNAIVYITAIAALATIAILLPGLRTRERGSAHLLLLWLGLICTAMLLNGVLGGAISEPQSRYETRMFWLIPLVALIALLATRRSAKPASAR